VAVYIREAHPSEGGEFNIKQPKTLAERCDAAKLCCTALKVTLPLVVDAIDDRVTNAYGGMPDRIYLIDQSGKVVYQGGRGPAGFRPGEMEQSLIMLLLERDAAAGLPNRPAAVPPTEPPSPR
jgi:hypothetical protein